MENYTYLIIGGGMTADSAVRGIRELDVSGRIGIISSEEFAPYNRPPLTKGLWFGKNESSIWRKTESHNVKLHLGKKITAINANEHQVIDSDGKAYTYSKLLLATGGTPRKLGCADDGVIYFRTLKDYHLAREIYDRGDSFVIIGGGFIGTELAAALAMNGKQVTLILKDPSVGCKIFPKKMSSFLSALFTEKGVQLVPGHKVTCVAKTGNQFKVDTDQGESFIADGVLAGVGIEPSVSLVSNLSTEVADGIEVDAQLKTNLTDIWAAGDVANIYYPCFGKRMRIEHEDTANTTGKTAGRNMAGAGELYTHLPFIYSDLFEISYEAIGELDPTMEIVEDWEDIYREGSLYYLKEGKLRGAIFINVWHQIDRARQMIMSQELFALEAKK